MGTRQREGVWELSEREIGELEHTLAGEVGNWDTTSLDVRVLSSVRNVGELDVRREAISDLWCRHLV